MRPENVQLDGHALDADGKPTQQRKKWTVRTVLRVPNVAGRKRKKRRRYQDLKKHRMRMISKSLIPNVDGHNFATAPAAARAA